MKSVLHSLFFSALCLALPGLVHAKAAPKNSKAIELEEMEDEEPIQLEGIPRYLKQPLSMENFEIKKIVEQQVKIEFLQGKKGELSKEEESTLKLLQAAKLKEVKENITKLRNKATGRAVDYEESLRIPIKAKAKRPVPSLETLPSSSNTSKTDLKEVLPLGKKLAPESRELLVNDSEIISDEVALPALEADPKIIKEHTQRKVEFQAAQGEMLQTKNERERFEYLIHEANVRNQPLARKFHVFKIRYLQHEKDLYFQGAPSTKKLVQVFKEELIHSLSSNQKVRASLVGVFEDKDKISLAFDSDSEEVSKELKKIQNQVNTQAKKIVLNTARVMDWTSRESLFVQQQPSWVHSGTGQTYLEAILAASKSESSVSRDHWVDFRTSEKDFSNQLMEFEKEAASLAKELVVIAGLFGQGLKDEAILSLLTANEFVTTGNPYQQMVLAKYFGKITIAQALRLQKYLEGLAVLARGHNLDSDENDFTVKHEGAVFARFHRRDVMAIAKVQKSILNSVGKPVSERLKLVGIANHEAVLELESAKKDMANCKQGGSWQNTEGFAVFVPTKEMDRANRKEFLYCIARQNLFGKMKFFFVGKATLIGIPIANHHMVGYFILAEKLENKIRYALQGKLSNGELDSLDISLMITPSESGRHVIGVSLSNTTEAAIPNYLDKTVTEVVNQRYFLHYIERHVVPKIPD